MTLARIRGPLLTGLLCVGALAGCGGDTTGPATRDEVAVFGYLYVGETISDSNAVYVTRVRPIRDYYDRDEAAVDNAAVTIEKVGDAPVALARVGHGLYANPAVSIEPTTSYRLRIAIPGASEITAETTTPHAFDLTGGPPIPARPIRHSAIPDSFPMWVHCEDTDQIFLVDVYCREDWQNALYVSPVGPDKGPKSFDEYGRDNGEPRHIFAYFHLRNLVQDPAGYKINFYDAMMAFYGSYDVQVQSIDDNYYRYLYKDHPEENGGVTGAIGVFGAAARRTWRVEVVK